MATALPQILPHLLLSHQLSTPSPFRMNLPRLNLTFRISQTSPTLVPKGTNLHWLSQSFNSNSTSKEVCLLITSPIQPPSPNSTISLSTPNMRRRALVTILLLNKWMRKLLIKTLIHTSRIIWITKTRTTTKRYIWTCTQLINEQAQCNSACHFSFVVSNSCNYWLYIHVIIY